MFEKIKELGIVGTLDDIKCGQMVRKANRNLEKAEARVKKLEEKTDADDVNEDDDEAKTNETETTSSSSSRLGFVELTRQISNEAMCGAKEEKADTKTVVVASAVNNLPYDAMMRLYKSIAQSGKQADPEQIKALINLLMETGCTTTSNECQINMENIVNDLQDKLDACSGSTTKKGKGKSKKDNATEKLATNIAEAVTQAFIPDMSEAVETAQ